LFSAYVFGSFAFYAGVLLGGALTADQLARWAGVGVSGVALRNTESRRPS